jgi:hypothetical protein
MLQIHELRLSCKFLLTLQNFLIATIDILSPIFSSVKQHQQQQQQSQISSPNKQNSFHQQWSPPNKYKTSPPKILSTQQAKTNLSTQNSLHPASKHKYLSTKNSLHPASKHKYLSTKNSLHQQAKQTTINVPPEPRLRT